MNFNIGELFLKGGFFMWPLLALSIISLILIFERIVFFIMHRYRFTPTLKDGLTGNGKNKTPLAKIISIYKEGVASGEEHCINVSSREAARQVRKHEFGLKFLATIGAISPLIGLLGTVWGMVQAFAKMAEMGDNVTTADFAVGIWTGLLTTVAGLIVAIPAVMATRMFESKVDRLAADINELASHLKEHFFPSNS